MTAEPESRPLLASVEAALGESGILDWRAHWHPGRPGAVAVRGQYREACARLLEAAGYLVVRESGWLTVRERERMSA